MTTPIITPYPNTEFERRLHRFQRQRDLALRGYERQRMSPELAEALRNEIRKALDADGKPFDVVIAQRVYDLAIAAKDMCVAATAGVGETIKTIANNGGPIESLGELEPGAPAVQVQASETFGARILRELMATFKPPKPEQNPGDLVLALADARRHGMTDVAEQIEIKLFGAALTGPKPIADTIDVPEGSYEHGFADGKLGAMPCFTDEESPYQVGYRKGLEAKYLDEARERLAVTEPHTFEAKTTKRWEGPAHETCEHCGKDPRNSVHEVKHAFKSRTTDPTHQACEHCNKDALNRIHTNRELFEVPDYSPNGVTL